MGWNKLKDIPPEEYTRCVEVAEHAIGLDGCGKVFKRDGYKFYRPYRNYYYTTIGDKHWLLLEKAGYAKHYAVQEGQTGERMTNYCLTPDGLQWLTIEKTICICLTH